MIIISRTIRYLKYILCARARTYIKFKIFYKN